MSFFNRYIIKASLLSGMTLLSGAMAYASAPQAFVNAPKEVFPLIDRITRMDMIEYFKSGMATPSSNNVNGKSRITGLSPESLSVEMSGASDYQLAMIPAGSDSIIALITTVKSPASDSRIEFFAKDWSRMSDASVFTRPELTDWLTPEGRKNSDDVTAFVPFLLVSYSYDPASQTLTLTNNTAKFLSADVYEIVSGYLKPQLVYRWNGKKFVAV